MSGRGLCGVVLIVVEPSVSAGSILFYLIPLFVVRLRSFVFLTTAKRFRWEKRQAGLSNLMVTRNDIALVFHFQIAKRTSGAG